MNATTVAWVAILVLSLGGPRSAPAAQAQSPTFRAVTDVVEVDVVVQDRQGRIITDLAPADFDVREEGVAQRVSLFYLVESGAARGLPVIDVIDVIDVTTGTNVTTAAPAASSRPAPRIFVAFFDDAHLTSAGFKRVQAAAQTLFSKEFKAGDVGGVVHNSIMANSRLTSNRDELLKAVRDARPASSSNSRLFDERTWPRLTAIEGVRIAVNNDTMVLNEAVRRACVEDESQCQNADLAVRGKAMQMADEARATTSQTLQNLMALLNGLSRMEGRKTVLLLSEGFIAEESWPLVQESVGLAARANARIYTLDARGLDRFGMAERLAGPDPGTNDSMSRLLSQLDAGADPVNSLAVDTGGFVIRSTNLFDAAVARIAADAGTYYVLGYHPDKAADGKFRRLSVTVTRPGLIVRARKGYVATPRAAPAPAVTTSAARLPPPPPAAASRGAQPAREETLEPAPPEPASTAPANADAAIVPAGPEGNGVRLRPNVATHVNDLAANEGPDTDATAGWEAYQRGDVATARTFLATAASRRTAQLWVHYALGQSEYALRAYPSAIAAWEKVRSGAADFEPVYFDLVDGYLQLKEYDKAIRVLRAAAERWPRDPDVFNALGVVQTARSSFDDAVKSFAQAIATAPGDAIGYFNLGKAMEMRYYRSRRYVQQLRSWVANEHDRAGAIENYERYLTFSGPYADAARAGLTRLNWTPK